MSKKVVDRKLPKRRNTEDIIFNLCVVRIDEFMEFVTKFRDIRVHFIEGYFQTIIGTWNWIMLALGPMVIWLM